MSTMQSTGNTGQIPNYLQNFQNEFNYPSTDDLNLVLDEKIAHIVLNKTF
jgi:hypothetical protein